MKLVKANGARARSSGFRSHRRQTQQLRQSLRSIAAGSARQFCFGGAAAAGVAPQGAAVAAHLL